MPSAGDASSGDVAASLPLVISLESTSLSLTVAPRFLKPLQNASHSITLQFGGPGPASKAGYQILIDYKDGTTETVVTDSNGQAFPMHAYVRFSNPAFNVTASFAGKMISPAVLLKRYFCSTYVHWLRTASFAALRRVSNLVLDARFCVWF